MANQMSSTQMVWDEAAARRVVAPFVRLKGGLMEALHAVQHSYGHIPEESYGLLAQMFNLSRAEVYGVKSFYHDFTSHPEGSQVIGICQAEACQARGSRALTQHVQNLLGIKLGETTFDGRTSLKAVYCLGNCAVSPNVTLDGRLHGRMSEKRFEQLLESKGVTS